MTNLPTRDAESGALPSHPHPRLALPAPPPVLAWALVLMAAMLFYFVHLVSEQAARGERPQRAQHAQAASVVAAAKRPPAPKNRQERVLAALR